MQEPIMEFKDEQQLAECLKEWQIILFLDGWLIKSVLLDELDMTEKNCLGLCERFDTSRACKISIKKLNHTDKECIEKPCHELTAIHELLHLKPCLTNYAENQGNSTACYYEQVEHTLLDQMAKSLLIVKYGLNRDWFKNF